MEEHREKDHDIPCNLTTPSLHPSPVEEYCSWNIEDLSSKIFQASLIFKKRLRQNVADDPRRWSVAGDHSPLFQHREHNLYAGDEVECSAQFDTVGSCWGRSYSITRRSVAVHEHKLSLVATVLLKFLSDSPYRITTIHSTVALALTTPAKTRIFPNSLPDSSVPWSSAFCLVSSPRRRGRRPSTSAPFWCPQHAWW